MIREKITLELQIGRSGRGGTKVEGERAGAWASSAGHSTWLNKSCVFAATATEFDLRQVSCGAGGEEDAQEAATTTT